MFSFINENMSLYQQQKSKMSKVNSILQERNIRQILEERFQNFFVSLPVDFNRELISGKKSSI